MSHEPEPAAVNAWSKTDESLLSAVATGACQDSLHPY